MKKRLNLFSYVILMMIFCVLGVGVCAAGVNAFSDTVSDSALAVTIVQSDAGVAVGTLLVQVLTAATNGVLPAWVVALVFPALGGLAWRILAALIGRMRVTGYKPLWDIFALIFGRDVALRNSDTHKTSKAERTKQVLELRERYPVLKDVLDAKVPR